MPVVGFLHAGSAAASSSQVIAFHAGLNENGFVDGSNVTVDVRWAEGHYDRLASLMTDLKRKPLSLVVTGAGPPQRSPPRLEPQARLSCSSAAMTPCDTVL